MCITRRFYQNPSRVLYYCKTPGNCQYNHPPFPNKSHLHNMYSSKGSNIAFIYAWLLCVAVISSILLYIFSFKAIPMDILRNMLYETGYYSGSHLGLPFWFVVSVLNSLILGESEPKSRKNRIAFHCFFFIFYTFNLLHSTLYIVFARSMPAFSIILLITEMSFCFVFLFFFGGSLRYYIPHIAILLRTCRGVNHFACWHRDKYYQGTDHFTIFPTVCLGPLLLRSMSTFSFTRIIPSALKTNQYNKSFDNVGIKLPEEYNESYCSTYLAVGTVRIT